MQNIYAGLLTLKFIIGKFNLLRAKYIEAVDCMPAFRSFAASPYLHSAAFNKAHAFSLLVHYFNGTVTRVAGGNASINAISNKRARIMFHRKMLKYLAKFL